MRQANEYPPIITVKEAAELLRLKKPDEVYKMIRKGLIPTFPPGVKRGKKIHRDTLLELVAKGGRP